MSDWRAREVSKRVTPGSQFIDLACGDNRLVEKLGFGTGVDIKQYGKVDLVLEDFSKLPFEQSSIDFVSILAALNYFDDTQAVLKEVARVLKPSGNLLITLLWRPLSVAWHQLRDRQLPRYAYSAQQLQEMLDGAGLKIVELHRFMLGLNCLYVIGRR